MNKLLATLAALGLSIATPGIVQAQQWQTFQHRNNSYYSYTLNSRGADYFKYQVPAFTFGVFTLKNNGRRSNFNVYVYDYSRGWRLLNKGELSGTRTELAVTLPSSQTKYAYIKIVNAGSQSSQYRFYANYVSPANRMAGALARTALTCDDNPSSSRATSRAVTAISSIVQGNNLGGFARNLLINEMTEEMRSQFGYGCGGDFMVNSAVSILEGFYRNY